MKHPARSLRPRILKAGPALAAILIAGCTPVAASQHSGALGRKVCEVLPGPPDAGLNRAVQTAVGAARAGLGVTSVVRAGLAPDVGALLNNRCALIIASGFEEAPSIFAIASRYARQRFLLADDWFDFGSAPDLTRPNVSVIAFEADQASFLAGFLAAAVSPDHIVGEYGGVNIPTVDLALSGFLAGARAWGEESGTHVRVLGWDGSRGSFVGNDFNQHTAFSITSSLIRGGAQVIFGVAGGAILGSAAAAASHPSVHLVGMYVDGYAMSPRYAGKWLTSVVFDMRPPVLSAIKRATSGGFAGGLYVGTLANGGVQLAPFHRLAHLVPKALLAKLQTLRTGIDQGWISTNPVRYIPREKGKELRIG